MSRCRNCPERFPKKKGKKFCSSKCKDEFWNAGATPTKALERRIFKLLKSDRVRAIIRDEVLEVLRRPGVAALGTGTENSDVRS